MWRVISVAHVLVGVGRAVEHDLGLGLVDRDVVGDLDGPQLATLVALADREARHDIRVGRRDGGHFGGNLGIAVVALLPGGELGRGRGRSRGEHERDSEQRRQGSPRRNPWEGAHERQPAATARA